jgi:hypothetical protein
MLFSRAAIEKYLPLELERPPAGHCGSFQNARGAELIWTNGDALRFDTHHERKRPGGDVVRLEDAAVGRRANFRIAPNAHHFVDEPAVGLRGRN